MIHKNINSYSQDRVEYLKWKRDNVTYRGIKEYGKDNGVYGSYGEGLYTVPASNKTMAKTYGSLYFVVNAKPTKPKVVSGINNAEILIQTLIITFCKQNNVPYDKRYFEKHTSIAAEMIKLGFDGIFIKSREYVNYLPKDVRFFDSEYLLERYFYNYVQK